MKLLPDEEKILSSNEDKIVLTDLRIMMNYSSFGNARFISIFLEDISAVELKYKGEVLLIILSILSILIGMFLGGQNGENSIIIGGVIGLVFFISWLVTRQHIISVSSNGKSSLNFKVDGMDKEKMIEFAHKVSLAKQNRIAKLYKL